MHTPVACSTKQSHITTQQTLIAVEHLPNCAALFSVLRCNITRNHDRSHVSATQTKATLLQSELDADLHLLGLLSCYRELERSSD